MLECACNLARNLSNLRRPAIAMESESSINSKDIIMLAIYLKRYQKSCSFYLLPCSYKWAYVGIKMHAFIISENHNQVLTVLDAATDM